jgi:hypothetical protein
MRRWTLLIALSACGVAGEETASISSAQEAPPCPLTVAGDFDQDLKSDLLWRHALSGRVVVWYMNGVAHVGGEYVSPGMPDPGWRVFGTADFDRDGDPDILWQNTVSKRVVYWWMKEAVHVGGDYTSPADGEPGATMVGTGHFNAVGCAINDCHPDILWSSGQSLIAWFMRGLVRVGREVLSNVHPAPAIGTADFDRDGSSDVVFHDAASDTVCIQRFVGTVGREVTCPGTMGSRWSLAAIGRYHDERSSDLVWRSDVDGSIVVWLMRGTTKVGESSITPPLGPDGRVDRNWELVGPR